MQPGPGRLLEVDHEAVLRSAIDVHGPLTGIVNLLGLGAGNGGSPAPAMLDWQVARGMSVAGMLHTSSTLGIKPACWLVTGGGTDGLGAAAAGGDVTDALLWGFARTAANEYPDLRLRRVDCSGLDQPERMATGLIAELLHPDAEDEIVLTGAGRHVLRLASLPAPAVGAAWTTARPRKPRP